MGDEQAISGAGERGRAPPRAVRTNMFIAAMIEADGQSLRVTVRNLSASGALVEGTGLPRAGTAVRLVRGKLCAAGEIVWQQERRCGLRLSEPVSVAHWMAKPGATGQAAVDLAVQRITAGQAPEMADAPTLPPDLATCISELEGQVAALSEALASDPETIARHAEDLQSLDLIAQGLARLRARVAS